MDAKVKDFNFKLREVLGSNAYRRVHHYAVHTRQQAEELIDEADVVSFDFFDTLVTRYAATPESVQHYVGHVLQQNFSRGDDFFAVRKYAETVAREKTHYQGDVDIDAIYAEIERGKCWTPELIDEARRLEETLDSAMLLPRADVVDLVRHAKTRRKRVIIISDSYFQRSFFERALKRLGIDTLIDDIYVSSERQARKDNGSLWDLVVSKEGLRYRHLAHFGDNLRSDIEMAAARGVRCAYLLSPSLAMAVRGVVLPRETDWREHLALGPLVAKLGGSPFVDSADVDSLALGTEHDLGYVVFGPILFYFIAWLLQNPALKQLKKLFFLAREGFFLEKLYVSLQRSTQLKGWPEAVYLYASRRVVLSASQAAQFDPAQVSALGSFNGTLGDLLAVRLGVGVAQLTAGIAVAVTADTAVDTVVDTAVDAAVDAATDAHAALAEELAQPITLPDDQARLDRFLTAHRDAIVRHATLERDAFVEYCRRQGVLDEPGVALVDAGYSGTIQHALQRILDRPVIGLYMATAPKIRQVAEKGGLAFGCFQDAGYRDMRPDGFLNYTVLLEALLTAPHGQVTRFTSDADGNPQPDFRAPGLAQQKFAHLEQIFAGVEQYAQDLVAAGGKDILSAVAEGLPPMTLLSRLVFDGLLQIDRTVLDALSLEDQFSGNGEVAIAGRFSPDAQRRMAARG